MDGYDLFRIIGAFYIFGGFIAIRALHMDHLLDQVLSGLSLQPVAARETQKRWLLGISSVVVGASGAALLVMNIWAVPLLALGTALQLFWLAWARFAFKPEDEDDARGRRQTTNAAIGYAAITALSLWLLAAGQLSDWTDPMALAIAAVAAGLLVYLLRHLLWRAKSAPGNWDDADDDYSEDKPVPPLHRVRLEPRWGDGPFIDADTNFSVEYDLYVPTELGDRIYAWSCAFAGSEDPLDRRLWVEFASPEEEAAHRAEGAALIAELQAIFGPLNVAGPIYPAEVRYGPPGATYPALKGL